MMDNSVPNIIEPIFEQKIHEKEKYSFDSFAELAYFKHSSWGDPVWYVRESSYKISFSYLRTVNKEFEKLAKLFLFDYVWQRRLKTPGLSPQRLRKLSQPLRLFSAVGVVFLSEIGQTQYEEVIKHISRTYKDVQGYCRDLNLFVRYLYAEGLIACPIDTLNPKALKSAGDKYGREANTLKHPDTELVRAIIELKLAIQNNYDGSARCKMDMLAVMTQVFQYGLGLRIGEILRLPKDCLIDIDGETFCNVWTEKGSEPAARYVPTLWREPLREAIKVIDDICLVYRSRAKDIENGVLRQVLSARFSRRVQKIESELSSAKSALAMLSESNYSEVKIKLGLLRPVNDDDIIMLRDLRHYLPLASGCSDATGLVSFYKHLGLDIRSKSLGKRKHLHYVLGSALKKAVGQVVDFRRQHFTYSEIYRIIQGRDPRCKSGSNYEYLKGIRYHKRLTSLQRQAFLLGSSTLVGGILEYGNALQHIERIIGGAYDFKQWLPISDAASIYPEFFDQQSIGRIKSASQGSFFGYLDVTETRAKFFRKCEKGEREYIAGNGFFVKVSSIFDAVEKHFVTVNAHLQAELADEFKQEVLGEGVEIFSKSFSIAQKVSEYLFVVPTAFGGVYNEHLPSLLGYRSVVYAFKPHLEGRVSAFHRYHVAVDDELISKFQTHLGRHWQTNSLFRAGLSASIVDKWMGRATSQSAHYDHQTARERADKVAQVMLREQDRFLGEIPQKLAIWSQCSSTLDLKEQLGSYIRTAHHSPLGYCIKDINLKPCEYHLKCLTGNGGLGCRQFVYDLKDPTHRSKMEAERDKAEAELARLFEHLDNPDAPKAAVEMHIQHQMTLLKNTTAVLERSELILNELHDEGCQEIRPFKTEGSDPDDCAFECGDHFNDHE
jgi:hypothetical protein